MTPTCIKANHSYKKFEVVIQRKILPHKDRSNYNRGNPYLANAMINVFGNGN